MAKNKWKKHENIEAELIEYLNSESNVTTNQIYEDFKEHYPTICWDTINRKLLKLLEEKKIDQMKIGRITVWKTKSI